MNVNNVAKQIKKVTDNENPKGYIKCLCGMSMVKGKLKKNEILFCDRCERFQI